MDFVYRLLHTDSSLNSPGARRLSGREVGGWGLGGGAEAAPLAVWAVAGQCPLERNQGFKE